MAAFRDSGLTYLDANGHSRELLDWSFFKAGPISLFHKMSVLTEAVGWFRQRGYAIAQADCGADPSEMGVLGAITAALGFSNGANLDGLDDYCWQLDVPDATGFILVLLRFDCVSAFDQKLAVDLLDTFAGASWDKLLFGRRFGVFVQSDDPRLHFGPVGGKIPWWNPREWLLKDRGL